jgi:hypothetical protein
MALLVGVVGGRPLLRGEEAHPKGDPEKSASPPAIKAVRIDSPKGSSIGASAFSPDGKSFAYVVLGPLAKGKPEGGKRSAEVVVCEAPTGVEARRLTIDVKTDDKGLRGTFLKFSPDGSVLAVALPDSPLALWDVKKARELTALDDCATLFDCCVAFSPDGKLLAGVNGAGEMVSIWEVKSGHNVTTFHVTPPAAESCAFSADGRFLLVENRGRERGKIELEAWEIPTGKKLAVSGVPLFQEAYVSYMWDARLAQCGAKDGDFRVRKFGDEAIILPCLKGFAPYDLTLEGGELVLWNAFGDGVGRGEPVLKDARGGEVRRWAAVEIHRFGDLKEGRYVAVLSPDCKAAAAVGEQTLFIWDLSSLKDKAPVRRKWTDAELGVLWDELLQEHGADVTRAMRMLFSAPEQAPAFLKSRLLPEAPPEKLTRLIADLDDDEFETRDKASHELRRLGEVARPALEKALESRPSAEARLRIEALLARKGRREALTIRGVRAVDVLEQIGTYEAREALKAVAEGPSGSLTTIAAKEVLERLSPKDSDKS